MGLWHLGQAVAAFWEEGCGSHGATLATPQLSYRLPRAAGARFPGDAPAWMGQNPGASQQVSWVSCCLSLSIEAPLAVPCPGCLAGTHPRTWGTYFLTSRLPAQ